MPIYVHRGMSPAPAQKALYGGLPEPFGFWLSISGRGWHVDTAIHILQLMVSGAFDRQPGLQVVIGHLGRGLADPPPRLDQQYNKAAGMEKLPSEVPRRHVHVTMGGFFMKPSFMATLDAFGADRIMFSVDYPFGAPKQGVAFLESLPLFVPSQRSRRLARTLAGLADQKVSPTISSLFTHKAQAFSELKA